MNFLADESCASCAAPVIRALRDAGHDVLAVSGIVPGADDNEVLERAVREERVLITEDLDFGNLVFARGLSTTGVILVRFRAPARRGKPSTVVEAVSRLGSRLRKAFVVVEPGRIRVSHKP